MNVSTFGHAVTCVTTPKVAMSVHVELGSDWPQMVTCACGIPHQRAALDVSEDPEKKDLEKP